MGEGNLPPQSDTMAKIAHSYQTHGILQACEHLRQGAREIGIYYCTGSGKSAISVLTALHAQFRHITVLTPMQSISLGFQNLSHETWTLPEIGQTLQIPELILLNDSSASVHARLQRHLEAETSYAVLHYGVLGNTLQSDRDLTGKVLIADEGHHTKTVESEVGTSWSHAIQKWLELGGTVIYASATPNLQRQVPSVTWTLVQMMLLGLAPRNILTDRVFLKETRELGSSLRAQWEADGRPAVLIKVQHSVGNREILAAVLEAFSDLQDEGIEVVNATMGDGRDSLDDAIRRGQAVLKGSREFTELPRIFVALKRMGEGTDAPWLSHVYFVGVPGSPVELDQGIGRATRCKYDHVTKEPLYRNYPEKWLDTMKVVFFTTKEFTSDREAQTWLAYCQRLVSYQYAGRLMKSLAPPGSLRADSPDSVPKVREYGLLIEQAAYCRQYYTLRIEAALPKAQPELSCDELVSLLFAIYVKHCEDPTEGAKESRADRRTAFRKIVRADLQGESSASVEPSFKRWVEHLYTNDLIQRFRKDAEIVDTSMHSLDAALAAIYAADPELDTSPEAIEARIRDFLARERRYPLGAELVQDHGFLVRYHQTTLADFTILKFGLDDWFDALREVLHAGQGQQNQGLTAIIATRQDVPEVVHYPKALKVVRLALEHDLEDDFQRLTLTEAHRLGGVISELKVYLSNLQADLVTSLKAMLQASEQLSAPQQALKRMLTNAH